MLRGNANKAISNFERLLLLTGFALLLLYVAVTLFGLIHSSTAVRTHWQNQKSLAGQLDASPAPNLPVDFPAPFGLRR